MRPQLSPVSRMDNILYITIFLVCILICSGVSLILHKYQGTISPVNQNVITKLSSFCVLLITPAVYVEVLQVWFHQMMTIHSIGNICDLENCIWSTGLPDCSGDSPPSLLCGDGVLRNRKCHQCAETTHCTSGMAINWQALVQIPTPTTSHNKN